MRWKCFLWTCVLLCAVLSGTALADEQPALRALIVTCDRFLSQTDTTPAAQENARLLAEALSADRRGYAVIRTECDTIGSVEGLAKAVQETFAGAQDGDLCVLYISTHGVYNPARSNLTAELLLSDGQTEEGLTPQALEGMLAAVKGTRVLLMDACHSGAFIGKGLSGFADAVPLTGSPYKILCSAGGSEDSWYWRSDGGETLHGAGYFTSILTRGLSADAGYPADADQDGRITLREAFLWLRGHYAASTPQVYPEADDTFALFEYSASGDSDAVMTDIAFEETVFSGSVSSIRFSFTLRQPMRVAYQLVYLVRGEWDFPNAALINEPETLAAGDYERQLRLHLADEDTDASGYVMLQIFSVGEERPVLHESRLISVLPMDSDIALSVECRSAFRQGSGREFPVLVRHDIPCVLTVQVQNIRGETVRYLAYDQASRPQRLVPDGTSLYWDGLLADGRPAPAGYYIIRVQTEAGGDIRQAFSPFFLVLPEDSAG